MRGTRESVLLIGLTAWRYCSSMQFFPVYFLCSLSALLCCDPVDISLLFACVCPSICFHLCLTLNHNFSLFRVWKPWKVKREWKVKPFWFQSARWNLFSFWTPSFSVSQIQPNPVDNTAECVLNLLLSLTVFFTSYSLSVACLTLTECRFFLAHNGKKQWATIYFSS